MLRPRHGRDHAGRCHLAHAMAFELGDIEIGCRIDGHIARRVELRGVGLAAIARVAFHSRAGDGDDDAIGADLAHTVVAQVRNIKVSRGIHRQTIGKVELGRAGRATIAAEAGRASSGDGRDDPAGIHSADAMVIGIGQEQIALRVYGHALNGADLRRGGRSAIAHVRTTGHGLDGVGRNLSRWQGRCPGQHEPLTPITFHAEQRLVARGPANSQQGGACFSLPYLSNRKSEKR